MEDWQGQQVDQYLSFSQGLWWFNMLPLFMPNWQYCVVSFDWSKSNIKETKSRHKDWHDNSGLCNHKWLVYRCDLCGQDNHKSRFLSGSDDLHPFQVPSLAQGAWSQGQLVDDPGWFQLWQVQDWQSMLYPLLLYVQQSFSWQTHLQKDSWSFFEEFLWQAVAHFLLVASFAWLANLALPMFVNGLVC